MSEVQLLGAPLSPYSFRVEIALKLKGIHYDFIPEDYRYNKSPLLLKYNPVYKKIPVLVHNGKPLAESLLILEYIDDTWDHSPLLPKHPYERSQARFWAKFIDEKCMPGLSKIVHVEGEEREKARDEAQELLKRLDDELEGKKFFGGESIGVVDIAAIIIGYWIQVIQEAAGMEVLSRQKHARIYEWMEALIDECSVIKENLPPRDKLLAHYQARFAEKESFIRQENQ